jgi:hypothetical protein
MAKTDPTIGRDPLPLVIRSAMTLCVSHPNETVDPDWSPGPTSDDASDATHDRPDYSLIKASPSRSLTKASRRRGPNEASSSEGQHRGSTLAGAPSWGAARAGRMSPDIQGTLATRSSGVENH